MRPGGCSSSKKKKKKIPVREIVFDNLKISSKKNLHIP